MSEYVEINPALPVKIYYEVLLNADEGGWYGVGFYDENKNFIIRPSWSDSIITGIIIRTASYSYPNAKYIRISFRSYDNAKVRVSQLDTDILYQPNPLDLLPTGATEGYFIARKGNDTFDFNDFAYYEFKGEIVNAN